MSLSSILSMLETILFYVLSFGVILFALGVVLARSAVYGVLCLVGAMALMAGLFVLLKAYFVATVLILVYAGAILVLFLFVVMMIDFRSLSLDWPTFKGVPILSGILSFVLFTQIFKIIGTVSIDRSSQEAAHGTAQNIGLLLFSQHILSFELTSFLILAAVVSVVVLAKKGSTT